MTNDGTFSLESITPDQAKEFVMTTFESGIGHASTAGIISTILDVEVIENRISVFMGAGDSALVFKLNTRPPEGVILGMAQIEALGYSWKLMRRIS